MQQDRAVGGLKKRSKVLVYILGQQCRFAQATRGSLPTGSRPDRPCSTVQGADRFAVGVQEGEDVKKLRSNASSERQVAIYLQDQYPGISVDHNRNYNACIPSHCFLSGTELMPDPKHNRG